MQPEQVARQHKIIAHLVVGRERSCVNLSNGYDIIIVGAGSLFSENIIRAYRKLAERCGAVFRRGERVESIVSGLTHHTVRTVAGTYYADRVLVCGGAFSAALLPELKHLVRPARKAIGWFAAPASLYGSGVFPAFIVNKGGSGHGFKFSNSIGEALSELLVTDRSSCNLSSFEFQPSQFTADFLKDAPHTAG